MSAVQGSRERELQAVVKAKDAELKQANAELEERGKLLYKTKVAIEQLQQELTASRREEAAIRDEANRVCEEQAAQLRQADEQVHSLEEQLNQALKQVKDLQAKCSTYESEAEQNKQLQAVEGTTAAQRLRDKDKRIASLEEELEGVKDQADDLDRMLRDTRSKLATLELDKEQTERMIRELTAKNKQLTADNQELEHQLEVAKQLADTAKREAARALQDVELRDKEKVAVDIDWGRKVDRVTVEFEDKLRDAERRLRDIDAAWQAKQEAADRSWVNRMQEVEQHWEKRLRDGMAACERKFGEEVAEWDRRLRDNDTAWQAKVTELEGLWRTRMSDEQRLHESDRAHWESQMMAQRAELESAWASRLDETRHALEAALEEATARAASERAALEKGLASERQASERAAAKRLEEAMQEAARGAEESRAKWAAERAAAEESWANRMAEQEAKFRRKMDELKRKAAARELEIDSQWKDRLEEASRRFANERELLSNSWSSRLAAAQEEAAARYRALQEELDSKVASISGRLADMAGKEGRREVQRNELARQVDELRTLHETEHRRRVELERALRDAAAMFKTELFEKQSELDAAYREARTLRQQLALQQVVVSSPRLQAASAALESLSGYKVAPGEPAGLTYSPSRPSPYHTTGHYASMQPMSPPDMAPGPLTAGGAPGPSPGARSLGAAAELDAELQALRAARAEYQRSVAASHETRNLDSLSVSSSPAPSRTHARPNPARSPGSQAAQYIGRVLVGDDDSGGDAVGSRRDTGAGDPAFDAWRNRLSSRLSSALRKLDAS